MSHSTSEATLDAVLAVIASHGDGGTVEKIARAMEPAIPVRRIRRLLDILVRQQRVTRTGAARATHYKVSESLVLARAIASQRDHTPATPLPQSGDASADLVVLRHLVQRPLADRPTAPFSRRVLDAYRPNDMRLLPAALHARWSAALTSAPEATDATCLVIALAAASPAFDRRLRLRRRTPGRPLTTVAATALLDRPAVAGMGGEIRRLWNHRAAVEFLTVRGRALVLSLETLAALYDRLTLPPGVLADPSTGAAPTPAVRPPLIRTSTPVLAQTTYQPPADRATLEGSLRQLVATAVEITDPLEQAWYVFLHLLLLLPFSAENLSMAVLSANIPLLRAGLRPTPFVSRVDAALIAGLAAWWELNRPELLAEAMRFARLKVER